MTWRSKSLVLIFDLVVYILLFFLTVIDDINIVNSTAYYDCQTMIEYSTKIEWKSDNIERIWQIGLVYKKISIIHREIINQKEGSTYEHHICSTYARKGWLLMVEIKIKVREVYRDRAPSFYLTDTWKTGWSVDQW